MKKAPMKRANYYLPVPLLKRLEKASKVSGYSASEHVRRALADHLAGAEQSTTTKASKS